MLKGHGGAYLRANELYSSLMPCEVWLQVDDYLLLYNTEIAGNQEVLEALADELSTLNLDFPSWFKPFNTAYRIPRPISEARLRRINGG